MDTIKVYIENMFYGLEQSEQVSKAKRELLEIMEDKYSELKSQGLNDNEAVGQVISEFGNLQELADTLGIRAEYDEKENNPSSRLQVPKRFVDDETVDKFLSERKVLGNRIGLALFLFIISPTLIILLTGKFGDDISNKDGLSGILFLFFAVMIGVAILIITGINSEKMEFLEKQINIISEKKTSELRAAKEANRKPFAYQIALGVCSILTGVISMITTITLTDEDMFYSAIAVDIFLIFVGLGIVLFIIGGIRRSSYSILLNEDEYNLKGIKAEENTSVFGAIYWPLVVIGYLAWSFIWEAWEISWIIWPIAGILYASISSVIEKISASKNN